VQTVPGAEFFSTADGRGVRPSRRRRREK
jgi:hypothetical protein